MLKLLALLAVATAGLFVWFVLAFMSDNNHEWATSEPVQIITGIGTIIGAIATLAVVAIVAGRTLRRRRPTH